MSVDKNGLDVRIEHQHSRQHRDEPTIRSRPRFWVVGIIGSHHNLERVFGFLSWGRAESFVFEFQVDVLVIIGLSRLLDEGRCS